ncbi:histidine phosphatase family protein [Spirosoma sp. 209]|uniref:SixA phosphatase family protein n=1 Tax=Spirosoma sp. 209 TaxID=1955701 RepID=UPI00098CFB47|nr:phosphoglycerate mutase family protein [Spirosoma sp. 209]
MRFIYGLLIGCWLATGCSTTTVYVVRHAEKVDETDSTDLSPAGRQRALALADTLARAGIDSIFTTPYRRTRQTAEPLATRLRLPIVSYSTKSISDVAGRVKRIRRQSVLVVGHSNTILEITQALGAQPRATKIASGDYDNLFQVRIRRGLFGPSVSLTEKTYGVPTPP